MKTSAQTSATHTPPTYCSGTSKSCSGNQGSGSWRKTRTVAAASVIAPSRNVLSGGCVVAETITGPSSRMANGFSQPAGQVEQAGELQEVVGEEQRRPVRVEPVGGGEGDPQAEVEPGGERDQRQAGAERQRESRTRTPTTRIAAVCPLTASQRRRISVESFSRRPEPAAGFLERAGAWGRPCRPLTPSRVAAVRRSAHEAERNERQRLRLGGESAGCAPFHPGHEWLPSAEKPPFGQTCGPPPAKRRLPRVVRGGISSWIVPGSPTRMH